MAVETKFPRGSTRSVKQDVVIVGANGLPVAAVATVEPGQRLVSHSSSLSYSSPTVTFNPAVNLSPLLSFSVGYTGHLILIDSTNKEYFIDPQSINNITKTLDIYNDPDFLTSPSSINLTSGWLLAEAALVNRLATTSQAVIDQVIFNGVNVNLQLDGSRDSVAIKDPDGNTLDINPDGSINVTIASGTVDVNIVSPGDYKSNYNEVSSVAASVLTDILTYTVPLSKTALLQKISVAGTNIAAYEVAVNSIVQDKKYTYFGDSLNEEFDFSDFNETGFPLSSGDEVKVRVIHQRPDLGDFNARLQVVEIN